ncbi:MAG: SCO family protein [Rhodocyclaceae bacterium]|nr:MAG: SCO family protein [Rhodocyclaceae bacterium]
MRRVKNRLIRAASYLAATLAFSVLQVAVAEDAADKPKMTARPATSLSPGLTLSTLDENAAFERSQAVVGKPMQNFALLDRDGKPVELSRYKGKPLLVNFVYTACFQVCPTTTRNLQKAVAETVNVMGADRFNIVTIGFNQPFDSPQAMKDFAKRYGLDLPNWEFLSPAQAIVNDVTQGFGFSFVATAAGFDHLNQITLVDAEGIIVRQVYGEKFTPKDLAEPLKLLITGSAIPPERNTVKELMERVRILCSVYDPVAGRYRTNYSVYFMIAGFITFMSFLIYMSINVWRNRRRDTPPPTA